MKYLVVMFTSRNDTLTFYNMLKKYNGFYSIINTPHSLSRSCGISIKIGYNLASIAIQIAKNNHFSSFKGIFEIDISNPNSTPKNIY